MIMLLFFQIGPIPSKVKQLDSKQPGNSKLFPVINLPVYFINSKQPGFCEQFYDDQKVLYHQVWLYIHKHFLKSHTYLNEMFCFKICFKNYWIYIKYHLSLLFFCQKSILFIFSDPIRYSTFSKYQRMWLPSRNIMSCLCQSLQWNFTTKSNVSMLLQPRKSMDCIAKLWLQVTKF